MKNFFSALLIAVAAMSLISCQPEDKKGDNGSDTPETPVATLTIDGKTTDYYYVNDLYAPMEELGDGVYAHMLTFSNVNIDQEDADELEVFVVAYFSTSTNSINTGDMLPASLRSFPNKISEGIPVYFTMQAICESADGADYGYAVINSIDEINPVQPAIRVSEKDGVYSISFEGAQMSDIEGGSEVVADFTMNAEITFKEVNPDDMEFPDFM